MGQAALAYVRRGWAVFPCRECDETVPLAKGGERTFKAKAPYTGSGLKDATRDERRVTSWWRQHPNALIGVPLGDNGLFVLDFDPRIDAESGEVFIRIRYRAGLNARMRFIVDGRVLQIVAGPAEIGRRYLVEFMAEESTPAGNPA
ncbi:bifunctional DNA primase/polymerase [Sphingomonas sp. 2378]